MARSLIHGFIRVPFVRGKKINLFRIRDLLETVPNTRESKRCWFLATGKKGKCHMTSGSALDRGLESVISCRPTTKTYHVCIHTDTLLVSIKERIN